MGLFRGKGRSDREFSSAYSKSLVFYPGLVSRLVESATGHELSSGERSGLEIIMKSNMLTFYVE